MISQVIKKGKGADLSLEAILTSPALFGLTTATNVQRAKCRIIEGKPLGDLANDPDVLEMCGGKIPDFRRRPKELLDISAIRIGKSLFAAAVVLWLTQTVNLTGIRRSDIVRLFVVALKMDGTRAVLDHLRGPMTSQPALRKLLVDKPEDITPTTIERSGLRIRHPSGHIIEVKPIPLDRGGGSAISVFSAGVVVDEFPRMIGDDDGVKNIEHFRDAVMGRLLPGAIMLETGSPWQPYGPAYDAVIEHFGKPDPKIVVLRTSAKPFVGIAPAWTQVEGELDPVEEFRTNPRTARSFKTDFLAEFSDGEEEVFPAKAIEDAWNRPICYEAEYGKPAIFADPSALRHDYWAAMVGGWVFPIASPEDLYEVEELGDTITPGIGRVVPGKRGWIRIKEDQYGRPVPRKDNKGLKPWFEIYDVVSWTKESGVRALDLVNRVGDLGRQYGCTDVHWDGYEQFTLADMFRREGLRPHVHPWNQKNKTEAVDHARSLFVERRVRLPKHEQLKNELQRFRAKATPGGNFAYIVAGGGGHGDHASCVTIAMRADLDGFLDRSPTRKPPQRVEIRDYKEPDTIWA